MNPLESSPALSAQISDWWDPCQLLEASVSIAAATQLDSMLVTVLQHLTTLVPSYKALILLPANHERITDVFSDSRLEWIIVASQVGLPASSQSLQIEVPTSESLPLSCIEAVAITRTPLHLKTSWPLNSDQNERSDLNLDPYIFNHNPQSILCIPLNYENSIAGMIYLEPVDPSLLGSIQLQQLEMIGRHIAICLRRIKQVQNLKIELRTRTFELQYTRTKLNALLDNSQFGIFIARREDGLLLEINQRGLEILGLGATDDIIGIKRIPDYCMDTKHWQSLILQMEDSNYELNNYEIQFNHSDQCKVWALLSLRLNLTDDCVEGVITDISARKEAELNLRKNAELIHQITDNLPALISYIDNQERYRFVNKYYEEWYGVSSEDIVDRHVRDLVGEEDYRKGWEYAQAALRGERINFELARHRLDGELRYLSISLIPHFQAGAVQGYFVLAPDITERKLAEVRYQNIFEKSTMGIFQVSPQGEIIAANPALAHLFGYESATTFIENVTNLHQFYLDPTQHLAYFQQLDEDTTLDKLESQIYRKDGSIIWISENVRAVRDNQDQIIMYEGFIQDITDRKQAEDAIRAQQAFLTQVINASPYAIFVKDQEGQFVIINQAGADLYNCSVEDLIGRKTFEVCTASVEVTLDHEEMFTTLQPKFIPEQPIVRNGKIRWLQTIIKPLIIDQSTSYIVGVSVDITERKQAENQLQEYLSLLQATLESTVEGMLATDLIGNPLTYNQRFLELWALTETHLRVGQREDRLQRMAALTRHPDQFLQKIEELSESELTDLEIIELQDGRVFERYTQPVRIDIRVVGRVWSYRDVTQRQRIEDALRESEARLRLALSAANMTAWDWDLITGEERWWPDTDSLGVVGSYTSSLNWIHPEDRILVQRAEQEAIAQQSDFKVEFRMLLEDGSLRWKSSRGNLLYNRNGRPIRMVGMSIDITERKAAEEALRRSEATNRALIEAIPDLLIRMDGDGRILSVKKGTYAKILQAECLDLDPAEVETLTVYDTLSDLQAQKRMKYVKKVLETGELHVYEQEIEIENETHYEEVRVAVSGVHEVLIIIRDITSRKLAEAALQHAKETAEAASRSKSTFLANMSHELRTPMNAILGFSQLMTRDPNLTFQQQQSLSIINRSGEHLLSLINAVLEMSKIESGRISLNEAPFDLLELLNMVEELFQPRIRAKQLYLRFEVDPSVPHYIISDESKLRQILINLIGNALKFTPAGGITVQVRYLAALSKVQIAVADTGEGIHESEQELLFQPFMQTTSGMKTQGGTGLGLAICRQYVELMGGSIEVYSQINQGSTFTFDIRVTLATSQDLGPEDSSYRVIALELGQPSYRILVVDDNSENQELLSQLLTSVGFETRVAANGAEAIQVWEQWQPHLIWMDIRMPVMDGLAATQQIKSTPQGSSTIIIALTASTFEHERSQVIEVGCDDFVSKPLQEAVIFEKMAQFLPVRYVYESSQSATKLTSEQLQLSSATLSTLVEQQPREWIEALHQAAIQLDTDIVHTLLLELPEELELLRQTLSDWSDRYRFDLITDLTTLQLNSLQTGNGTNS